MAGKAILSNNEDKNCRYVNNVKLKQTIVILCQSYPFLEKLRMKVNGKQGIPFTLPVYRRIVFLFHKPPMCFEKNKCSTVVKKT